MDATSEGTLGGRLRGRLLLLRGRAGLTQRALAAQLGISAKAVQNWEAGKEYPSPARLQALIALYAERGVFTAGREVEEARALWTLLRPRGQPAHAALRRRLVRHAAPRGIGGGRRDRAAR